MKLPVLQAGRPTIVVGSCVVLVLVMLLAGILYFLSLRASYVHEIDSITPRTARLLGILESADALEVASSAAESTLRDLAFPPGRDSAAVAASLQQEVREVMTEAGMSVTGSQILATRLGEGYDRITLDISADGNIDALDESLAALELMRPLLFVESLKIRPARTRRGAAEASADSGDPRQLNARFQVFALKVQP